MRAGFYPKLAASGMIKNKRMYLPYILTCTGMVMMYYIIQFLSVNEPIGQLSGAEAIQSTLAFGSWVIAIFACIFLFYTNSFLIRRRKKEFGLYNILGMDKWNISRILLWESLIIAAVSLGAGLLLGIALSKLAELGLINIMKGDVVYSMSVSFGAIVMTAAVFGVIFALLFLNSLRQIRFSSAISLVRSENAGEKPPRGNWLLGLAGLGILGGAYYIAVTIKNPLAALAMFFIAVVMVIVGTYLVMIAGSVLFCRILQRNKGYYYKSNHFVSVSSMVYRMKRNGAGLASICILATMVLVMISSTASLYFGEEDSINSRYPRDINLDFRVEDPAELSDEFVRSLREELAAVCEQRGITPENSYAFRNVAIAGLLQGTAVETNVSSVEADLLDGELYQFRFVPLADYNAVMGAEETLEDGEVLLWLYRNGAYGGDVLSFNGGNTFHVKKQVDDFVGTGETAMSIVDSMVIVVPDLAESLRGLDRLADFNGDRMIKSHWIYNFDTGADDETQLALRDDLLGELTQGGAIREKVGFSSVYLESQALNREDFYGVYGGLFYLGIILSLVFILAAVLIIYYKQISEGYEDQSRFEIMQKVGMTKREIRRSINSQLLTVFFLPLIFAAMHLAFAFPMIRKLLLLFNLSNAGLFAMTTVISVAVFAVFYTFVYQSTSNAYYNIVSGARE